jgi:antitoxin ChpS
MATALLRRAGGSTIVTLPAKMLEDAGLSASSTVDLQWDETMQAIVMRPAKPRYTMAELLADCDSEAPLSDEDRTWLADGTVGREIV